MCPGAAAGLSISAAPATKSDTTASIGMPLPAIMMPVWPVARKVTSRPRAARPRPSASAVYFLPSAQSVPTVRMRRPARGLPLAMGISAGGVRTSIRRRPWRTAASFSTANWSRRTCMPETMSRPAASASASAGTQLAGMLPPGAATPMTMAVAPFAAACLAVSAGRPVVTVAPGRRSSPTQRSPAQSRRPKAVLAKPDSVTSPRNSRQRPTACVSFGAGTINTPWSA